MSNDNDNAAAHSVLQQIEHLDREDCAALAHLLATNHPTYQQNFMRQIVMPFIKEMSEKDRGVDDRNSDSHDAAKKFMKIPVHLPYV